MSEQNIHEGSVERALIDPDFARLNLVVPPPRNPFYIMAPPYTRMSAGIKVLHLICHHLNLLGYEAYLFIHPSVYSKNTTYDALKTPILTEAIVDEHFAQGRLPIVIYPEVARGNMLQAPFVVRYLMNYIGLLGGDSSYPATDYLLAYSEHIAKRSGCEGKVLFLPISNRDVFYPPKETDAPRFGRCYTASKYKNYHLAKTFPVTDGLFEVTRSMPDSLSQQEMGDLFRRSELLYAYENTSITIDAVLCGCPVVYLPNEHLEEILGKEELKNYGFAWGDSEEEIARAKATVGLAQSNFQALNDEYFHQLVAFVADVYERTKDMPYIQKINSYALSRTNMGAGRVRMVVEYWRKNGTGNLIKKIKHLYERDGLTGLCIRFTDALYFVLDGVIQKFHQKKR